MSYFSDKFNKKEKLINRTIEIEENLYKYLEQLSKNVYDASISKLINESIDRLYKSKDIKEYKSYNIYKSKRGIMLRESSIRKIEELKKEFNVPSYKLINISIYNALKDEGII